MDPQEIHASDLANRPLRGLAWLEKRQPERGIAIPSRTAPETRSIGTAANSASTDGSWTTARTSFSPAVSSLRYTTETHESSDRGADSSDPEPLTLAEQVTEQHARSSTFPEHIPAASIRFPIGFFIAEPLVSTDSSWTTAHTSCSPSKFATEMHEYSNGDAGFLDPESLTLVEQIEHGCVGVTFDQCVPAYKVSSQSGYAALAKICNNERYLLWRFP